MSQIGFVLLTHTKPEQMLRLVHRLNTMFGDPPIVCHHDFGKCPLPDGFLPPNVEFVRPHLSTGWAEFSVVRGTALAMEQLYRRSDSPDWCVVLSGADYPVKPAAQILENLNAGGYDAHIEGQEVRPDRRDDPWHRMFTKRLYTRFYQIPTVDKRLRPKTRRLDLPHALGHRLLPFRPEGGLRCFAGSQWFSLGRRAAEYAIAFQKTPDAAALSRHYERILFSEESYFQTILHNAPGFRLDTRNWLYLDWSEKQANPKLLTLEDLDAIKAAPVNFARKFDPERSAALLDALDTLIDSNISVIDVKETVSR